MSTGDRDGVFTIMFTDVQGSTDLATRRGDEVAKRLIDLQRRVIRERVERYEGRIADSIGDGFMIVFPSTRRAISCAVDIQGALEEHGRRHPNDAVRVRIGLNVGEVLNRDGHPFGAAVNAAARVASTAAGGEILVSDAVRQLAGTMPGVTFRDRGRHDLKGFPERARLYSVDARTTTAASSRPRHRPRRVLVLAATPIILAAAAVAVLRDEDSGARQAPGGDTSPEGPTARHDPPQILIGRSIGAVRLGMSEDAVKRAYDRPDNTVDWTSRGRSGETVTYSVEGGALRVAFYEGRVVHVSTSSSRYTTANGIRVGTRDVPWLGSEAYDLSEQTEAALRSGALKRLSGRTYVWRGFVYGRGYYCSRGFGAVTQIVPSANRTRVAYIGITSRDFVPDLPVAPGIRTCFSKPGEN